MCGIFAWMSFVDSREPTLSEARHALHSIAHRGPDGWGEWYGQGTYIGHRRLKVIDLSSDADQPFVSGNGRFVMSYNGEIYNYRELRHDLRREGVEFVTESDTEVFLAAFEKWGVEAFAKFDGMFAVAIYDTMKSRLILARDPIGQKPLYIYSHDTGIVCASELRAILKLDRFRFRLDAPAIARFLALSCFMGEETPIRDVRKLAPGSWLSIDALNGRIESQRYWSARPGNDIEELSDHEAMTRLEKLLAQSCSQSLRSDVPVGLYLSGGVDSSLIASFCANSSSSLCSFNLSMGESDFDESEKATLAARTAGVLHHTTFEMTPSLAHDSIDLFFSTSDEPHGDPGFVTNLALARLIRPSVTVALAGDGADELFWGYETYKAVIADRFMRHVPGSIVRAGVAAAHTFFPVDDTYVGTRFKIDAFAGAYPAPSDCRIPLWLSTLTPGRLGHLCPGIDADFFDLSNRQKHLFSHVARPEDAGLVCAIDDELTRFYQRHFLPDFICAHTDRSSMTFGLEVRAPFLAPDLIEFANHLPGHLKRRGTKLKYILREMLASRGFPQNLHRQRKQGFTLPMARWLKTALAPTMRRLMSVDLWNVDGLISAVEATKLMDDHLAGRANNYRILFNLMAFAAWRHLYPSIKQ